MAKIARYNGNLQAFGINAVGTERTVFGAETQSDTLDANVNTDFLRGWGIVGLNDLPTRQDFNAMGFTFGQLLAYLFQSGVAEWNVAQEYHTGGICTKSGVAYISTSDSNTGNDPATDFTNWALMNGARVDSGAAWGVTASYSGETKDLVAEGAGGSAIFLKPDGTKLFRGLGSDVFAYTMSTANDVSTASYDTVTFATSATTIRGLFFKPDGTKMYVVDNSNETVYEYTLSTAWLISSAGTEVTFDLGSVTAIADAEGLFINPDGGKLYSLNSVGGVLYEYNMPTPWSVVGMTDSGNTLSVIGQDTGMREIRANTDGTNFFLIGSGNDSIYQYSFGGTAWSLSGAAYDTETFVFSDQSTAPLGFDFTADGTKFILIDNSADVYGYDTRIDYQNVIGYIGSDNAASAADTNGCDVSANAYAIYRAGSAFLANCNRFQVRKSATGQYYVQLPEGLTFDDIRLTGVAASTSGRFLLRVSGTGGNQVFIRTSSDDSSGATLPLADSAFWASFEVVR